MKRGLLMTMALFIGTWIYGQAFMQMTPNQDINRVNNNRVADRETAIPGPIMLNKSTQITADAVFIGQSENVYTLLVEQSSCLTANQDLGLIQFIHRGKVGVAGCTSSGDVMRSVSEDGGDTWHTSLLIRNATGLNNRYPSGVIYNPTGNTNVDNSYSVYAGPSHNGASTSIWDKNYFGSIQYDSSHSSTNYFPMLDEGLIRNGMIATDDGKVHVIGSSYSEVGTSSALLDTIYMVTGEYNATNYNFDWTTEKFTHRFMADDEGGDFAYTTSFNTTWSQDGTIGYYWTIGRDSSNDTRAYTPIVWKTTNSGTTWNMMPVFDYSSLPIMADYLYPVKGVSPATYRPAFTSNIDGTVDANGNLHLIAQVLSAWSNNDDSLTYIYVTQTHPIFDFYTTNTGWEARHLADTWTNAVPADESGFGAGADAQGWDMRLQAGRTLDGTKIFATWSDTDTNEAIAGSSNTLLNFFPDLWAASWDIITGKQTNAVNFTIGTSLYATNYYQYMSEIVLSNNGTYTIPMTKCDFGTDPADPVSHSYVKNIEFSEADYVTNPGFNDKIENIVSLSQNIPNPFSGETKINLTLNKSTNISMMVSTITGQKVYEMNYGTKSAGNHTINFNSNNLSSGIYFYTIQTNNGSITKKMIIE